MIQTKELAYVLGVYMGDGCAIIHHRKDGKGYNYAFKLKVIDEDFVENTKKALLTINPKYSISIYHYGKFYDLHCRNKDLVFYLKEITKSKTKIPDWIIKSSKNNKRAFLAGLMDSDGWVQVNKRPEGMQGQIQLGFCSTSKWIDNVMDVFDSLGCIVGNRRTEFPESRQGIIKSKKPLHRFNINVESFIKSGCYFLIKRKQERLRDYNVVSQRRQERKRRRNFLKRKLKKLIKLNHSNRELARIIGVSHETIRIWKQEIMG